MAKIIDILPELTGEELIFVQSLLGNMTDEQATRFASIYRTRRRDPLLILVLSAIGLIGIAGVQRLLTDQIGMGILYFFTAGLCLVGSIMDMVNYQKLAFEYNSKIAREISTII